MKVAFITEHFDPKFGGAEVYMSGLSRYLIEHGCEVHFITQDFFEGNEKLICHVIALPNWVKKIRSIQWRMFAAKAEERALSLGVDVVVGTGKCTGATVYQPHGGVVHASQHQNIRMVGSSLVRFFKRISNKFSSKHRAALDLQKKQFDKPSCQFVAISEMVRKDMHAYHNISDEHITLLYNGVDLQRFKPVSNEEKQRARQDFGFAEDEVAFAIVAHNFALKGVREIIEAVAELKKRGGKCRVVVAGGGKAKKFIAMAKSYGVDDCVKFSGALSEPEKLYAAVDAYLQPTWYDPCSLVVLEAMAAGLPVLTTAFNGAGELVEEGTHGYVISSPKAIGEFVQALEKLSDRQHCRKMGLAARVNMESHSLENNYAEMLKIFRSTIKQ